MTHKTGVSPYVFCGNAALTVCAPHCGYNAPKVARSWPCSLCAEVMIGLWYIIITHKIGVSPCVFCGNAALTVCPPHCGHNAPTLARSWPCSLCAEVMIGLWYIIIAHKTGVSPCVFCGNAALTICAPHCGHNAPKLARSWPCSLCAEVMVGLW